MNHWAIYGSGLSLDTELIRDLLSGKAMSPFQDLHGKKGLLFSNTTLQSFIKEEVIHDNFTLSDNGQKSIRNYSSGEQKKALLHYLFSKKPDFIILESVFDMLDSNYQKDLLESLSTISNTTSILQIFRRRDEVLPFIHKVIRCEDNQIIFSGSKKEYDHQFSMERLDDTNPVIPGPIHKIKVLQRPLIRFDGVTIKYEERIILNHITWEINKGEFWQLIGPNGSGKTTLLTMLTGDNPKAYGQNITLFGRKKGSGESVWEIKKMIGYVTPAMTELFNGRHSVEHMIISGLYDSIGLYKTGTIEEKILANKWINLIGLQNDTHSFFSKLTEEKQCMVLIARAMIKHPPLLILDEPSHGLDDQFAALLTTLINKISRESNTAIIYVSHKKEKGLKPDFIFELTPNVEGSIGEVKSTG